MFSALKNGNQGQKLMSITIIFNGNCLFEPTSPRTLKILHALIKFVLNKGFKCSKVCYFAHFSLENSNSRAITHALTKTQAPVTIMIYSVAKMKLENKLCPHPMYGFQIIAPLTILQCFSYTNQ